MTYIIQVNDGSVEVDYEINLDEVEKSPAQLQSSFEDAIEESSGFNILDQTSLVTDYEQTVSNADAPVGKCCYIVNHL